MKKLLPALLAILAQFAASAFEYNGLHYGIIDDNTCEVASEQQAAGALVIPATAIETYIEDGATKTRAYTVTRIAKNAFHRNTELTSVEIPNTVTEIAEHAFSSSEALTSVDMGNGVVSIGQYAFDSCSSLASMALGNSVETIGKGAFQSCGAMTEVVFPASVRSVGENAFYWCKNLTKAEFASIESLCTIEFDGPWGSNPLWYARHLYIDGKEVTELKIPDNVTAIGNYAFNYCKSLTSVEIPESVTSIGDYAFHYCDGLPSVEIPESVTSIGDNAFEDCYGLKTIVIPDGVTRLGAYAYHNCSSATTVSIGNSVSEIGEYAFAGCYNVKTVVMPGSIARIGAYAFGDCPFIADIYYDAPVPVEAPENVFHANCYQNTVLHASDKAADKIKITEPWSLFAKVDMSGIDAVEAADTTADADIYTLQGVKAVKPLRPGIYIANGRKFLLK